MSSTDETRHVTLEEIRAMHERGELAPIADDAPEADLPDAFWGKAKVVEPRVATVTYTAEQINALQAENAALRDFRSWVLANTHVIACKACRKARMHGYVCTHCGDDE